MLPSGPLRTVRESFPSHGSSPSNTSKEVRFGNRPTLGLDGAVALWMEQDTVLCTSRATQRAREAVLHAPPRKLSDFHLTQRTESALRIPEVAKHAATAKRSQHLGPFALREVGFPDWIVRVSFTFNLNVPFDERATSALQPNLDWLPIG